VDRHGSPEAIRAVATENLDAVRPFAGDVRSGWINRDDEYTLDETIDTPANHSARLHESLRRRTGAFLDANAPFLAARVAEGRIREGHGDLHAGNICLTDAGFVIYDCIEFTPRFRCADVAAEVAFLGADLDAAGFPELADRFTDAYGRLARDPGVARLQGFYRRHFAAVRGKVASIRSTDTGLSPEDRAAARREAMRYFQLAASYGGAGFQPARPEDPEQESEIPPLILTCGLPASGKSSAARAIALALRTTTLRSDAVRKQLAGMAPTDRPADPDVLYSPEMSDRTYRRLLDEARRLLAGGRPAVVDAMFSTPRRREQFARLARAAGARLIAVHVRCPEQAIRRRMARRADDASEVSDADWNVYLSARDNFQDPAELPGAIDADGTLPPEAAAAAVIDALLE
jgi:uncharacterized protein